MRRRAPALADRIGALGEAVEALKPVAGPGDPAISAALTGAEGVLHRAAERGGLSAAHTVVALAGATGSGKSSLTNALAGQEVTAVGARRPTTGHPVAVVWGTEPSGALLDWLGITRRIDAVPASDVRLDGLVLVDLPDIDSVKTDHHDRAARLAERVDMLVWVLDPQKYADAVVHQQYLRPMARHAEVTLAVLNQVDTLAPADARQVIADLGAKLADDGLSGVNVLGVSALTGAGLPDLRRRLGDVVARRAAVQARLTADVATAADRLVQACPAAAPGRITRADQRHLVDRLSEAGGVEMVAAAVAGSYRYRARRRAGWPVTRWLGRFRPDPLRRLHLGRPAREMQSKEPGSEQQPVVAVSSSPPATPAVRSQAATALRRLAEASAGETTGVWRDHLREGAMTRIDDLPDALDAAISSRRSVHERDPRWFAVPSVLQWLWFAAAVTGALWLGVIAGVRYLGLPMPWTPQLGPVPAQEPWPALPALPWPTVLLVAGLLLGVITSLLVWAAARIGAARRRRKTRAELGRAVEQVAERLVLAEVRARIDTAERYARAVELARA
ncbi:50S ribosome-binding GTPase [Ruania alkalisoli]|uniref:50S ribosome-binding GTPase n=1 Tax=Ruania alkalisoli TaxID=2779775 RepID=A0A7M1SNB9_9MICO|nr:GTPase [Ruania alkalisoli]QOR69070.1 50S ribosome-binding GTPase [Ruania alkalisoli]